ncbi:hypothetical protein [Chromobacterium alticapitis]|uniref:hypothetical protein n=1 Tax=Chromobacterium alticapitis TaxID=2073169 RepID=UPI0011B06CA9|nr:hypothetical protein [Chromobacterium alticapitis]
MIYTQTLYKPDKSRQLDTVRAQPDPLAATLAAAPRIALRNPRFEIERCRMISRIPLSVRRKQARDQHESFLYAVAKPQLSDEERSRQQKVRQRAHDRDDAHFLADRCDDLF